MQQESLYIQDGLHQLHLRHIFQNPGGVPVLMLHGTIENGKIFYTLSGKGLACYLAKQGFDVYVADFRGKGQSTPNLKEDAGHGQFEAITRDIPLFLDFITERCQQPMHVICHSWGGVLLASCLARYPERCSEVLSTICFGTKRSIYQNSLRKRWTVDFLWNRLAPFLARKKGYIDAVKLKLGADNESLKFLKESIPWVKVNSWCDPVDGFDYHKAATSINWPKTWHITGVSDHLLGHKEDVKAFIEESNQQAEFTLLGKGAGNRLDYGHINILTHPHAIDDHFPEIVRWLNDNQQGIDN